MIGKDKDVMGMFVSLVVVSMIGNIILGLIVAA